MEHSRGVVDVIRDLAHFDPRDGSLMAVIDDRRLSRGSAHLVIVESESCVRCVVIDEAFGRGDDESTQFGLDLFKKLNLQLLIVTPMQKIHVIENYIHSVHYVSNPEGNESQIRNLSIEEYKEEKKQHHSLIEIIQ